jgi:hypothetical protein
MTNRSEFRSIAKAALAADLRMQAIKQLSAWASNIAAEDLPVLGVVTPQERISDNTFDTFERSTLLQVVVKRFGTDDMEDVLDEDAEAIEAAVFGALMAQGFNTRPEEVTITLNGEGEQRIGTVVVTFRVTYFKEF